MITVSVVIPMRNEERHIEGCLNSLLEGTDPRESYEIIVVDGGSSDRSVEIVRQIARKYTNVNLLSSRTYTTPAGMNLGIRSANGRIVVIAGAHTIYPPHFIENCVKYLEKTGADVVGGPILTLSADNSFGARLAAAVLSNPFGVGNSRFRTSFKEGWADTVPFGAYRREVFDRVGYFNENLIRNQDNDLLARIRRAGGRVYLTPVLLTRYKPVQNFQDLLRQSFCKSQWHMVTLYQNKYALGLRHLAPAAFVTVLGILLLLSFQRVQVAAILLAFLTAYLFAGFWYGIRDRREHGSSVAAAMPFACLVFHIAYGLGTLAGLRHLLNMSPSQPNADGPPTEAC